MVAFRYRLRSGVEVSQEELIDSLKRQERELPRRVLSLSGFEKELHDETVRTLRLASQLVWEQGVVIPQLERGEQFRRELAGILQWLDRRGPDADLPWPPSAHPALEVSQTRPKVKRRKEQYRPLDEPPDGMSLILIEMVEALIVALYGFDPATRKRKVLSSILKACRDQHDKDDRVSGEVASGWIRYIASVQGKADGLLRSRCKKTLGRMIAAMLKDKFRGQLPAAERLGLCLGKGGKQVSQDVITEALNFLQKEL